MSYWKRLRPEEGGRFADPVGPDAETVARIRAADDCVVKRKTPGHMRNLVGKKVRILVDKPSCAHLYTGDVVEVIGRRETGILEIYPHWVLHEDDAGEKFEVLP